MFHYINRMDGTRSWFFHHTTKSWNGGRFPISLSVETAWRKNVAPGAEVKIGTYYSENPLKLHFSIGFFAIWLSLSLVGLNKILIWLSQGHKRKIGLKFHDGMAWWNVWYDEDGGWDNYHKCKHKQRPGKRYRSWACLRQGNIYLNPINVLYGAKRYSYEDVESYSKIVVFTDVPGDSRLIDFKLQKMTRGRERGPKWARKQTFEGYIVDWNCDKGIPTENDNDWKGGSVYASSLPFDELSWKIAWFDQAETKLKEWIAIQRERYGYLHDGYDARSGGWRIDG